MAKNIGWSGGVPLDALSESERVLASCAIAREKIEIGNYDDGCAVLSPWWKLGDWPNQEGLTESAAAELLLMAGSLTDSIARTKRIVGGQRVAEALLSGAIALLDHTAENLKATEARIELACCYYHQGLFDLAHSTLRRSISSLSEEDYELRAVALFRLAILERHRGRLREALALLDEVSTLENLISPWTKGRFWGEMANTLKDFGVAEECKQDFDRALSYYREASIQFEQLGNLRYVAVVENNRGYLLLSLKRFEKSRSHLERARNLFDELGDTVGCAQVDETLAQLYLASDRHQFAERSIKLAVGTLEGSGEDALLAEALTTQGLILCRLAQRQEAKPILERARRVAERCGNREGAGRALLILIEEMCDQLADDERREIGAQANQLLANSQQQATRERLRKCLETIAEAHTRYEAQREQEIHAQKMAALGELSFGVAHNVNNTLTGILGRAQLILRNSNDPAKIEAGLELIIKSAEDGAHIIRRIQDFARQRPSREFETVAHRRTPQGRLRDDAPTLGVALRICAYSLRPPRRLQSLHQRRPGRTARSARQHDLQRHRRDAIRRRSARRNPGKSRPRRRLHHRHRHRHDTRSEATSLRSVLHHQRQSRHGHGPGGSFGIIRRHEGSIEVDSEPGRGTTFKISLPKVTLPERTEADNSGTVQTAISTTEDKVRVMVVDDETHVREVLIEALEAEGCEVVSAESGEIALALYDQYDGKFDARVH